MKKKISVLLMVLVMVLSATVTSYAAVGDEVMPLETAGVTFIIDRISGTKANADVIVTFSDTADEYSVIVYLQKNSNGSWVNDTSNPDYVFYNNGINSDSAFFEHTYSSLSNGVNYRLMVVSRDIRGSNQYRTTSYSNTF